MYCPGCGTETSMAQKFCRSCGLDLQMVPQILKGNLSAARPEEPESEIEKAGVRRMIKIMSWGGIILFAGLVILVVGKKYLHDELLSLIGGLVSLLGTFIMGYAIFSAMWSSTAASRQLPEKAAQTQPELDTNRPPESLPEPMLSVTERTTRFIETSSAKPSEKEAQSEPGS